MWHILYMKKNSDEPAEDIRRWLTDEIEKLWPLGLGSLSLRRSPCIRDNCHVCETGEKHASYVYYGRRSEGKRSSIYVPDELADEIEIALANGNKLKELLYEASHRYIKALKRERSRDLGTL